jgi:hypothetical protein
MIHPTMFSVWLIETGGQHTAGTGKDVSATGIWCTSALDFETLVEHDD